MLLIEHDMSVVMGHRADHGARPRREDRRGHAGRDPQQPAGDRGLPRQVRHRRRGMTTTTRRHRRGDRQATDARRRRHPRLLRQHRRGQGHLARRSTRARSSPSSAPTAPASRPPCARSPGCCGPRKGDDHFEGQAINGIAGHEVVKLGICQSPEGRRIFPRMTVAGEPRPRRVPAQGQGRDRERPRARPRAVPAAEGAASTRRPARCPAASSRCWRRPRADGAAAAAAARRAVDGPGAGAGRPDLRDDRAVNEQGTTVLLVEQNALAALQIADRAYVLESGVIKLQGDAG